MTQEVYEQLIKGEQQAYSQKGRDGSLGLLLQRDLPGLGLGTRARSA